MATVKFICSSSEKIDSIPFKAGQVMFVQDERAIYVDGTERVCYRQIITLDTEAQRTALSIPLDSFYFVNETKILWQFDNGWHQITTSPKVQIVFDDKDNFPIPGDSETIYIDGLHQYRYLNDQYQLMTGGGSTVWVDV